MLKFIFFFFGVIGFIYEVWTLSNLKKLFNFKKDLEKLSDERKESKIKLPLLKSLPDSTCSFIVCNLFYSLWAMIGLFTSQWLLFIPLLLMGFINNRLTKSRTIGFESFATISFIDGIISAGLIGFAIINAIHLHIPLWTKVLEYFK